MVICEVDEENCVLFYLLSFPETLIVDCRRRIWSAC